MSLTAIAALTLQLLKLNMQAPYPVCHAVTRPLLGARPIGRQTWGMDEWPPSCYQRATAFVTDSARRLLVFDHVGDADVPTQVPAGGIAADEEPEGAVTRE